MNIIGTISDIFDHVNKTSLKRDDQTAMMLDIFNIFEENMLIEGLPHELDACLGIDPILDKAIEDYNNSLDYGDDEHIEDPENDWD